MNNPNDKYSEKFSKVYSKKVPKNNFFFLNN